MNMEEHQKDKLSAILTSYFPVRKPSLDLILENCTIIYLEKMEHFSQSGKRDLNEYFILEGIAHRYVMDEEGQPVTTGFYLPESVVTPNFARTIDGKSIFTLQALLTMVIAKIPVKVLDSFRYSYDDIRSFGQKVVERELLRSLSNEVAHRSMSARARLLLFREQYPNLENRVPHTYIASYLGITPVSFSRLRNELAKK
jgi:CRP-like cAMP-binding protein